MRDLRALFAFVEVVRSGSFTAAASNLKITPAAVSKSIAKLESELSLRLFNRTTRQLHLTAEGQGFFNAVSDSLSKLDQALELVSEAKREPSGVLRVSMVNSFGKACILPHLKGFMTRYPRLQMEIGFNDNMPDLVAKGFDVGIRYGEPADTRYISRRLCRVPLGVYASPEFLRRHGEPKRPEDIPPHLCIRSNLGAETGAWRFIDRAGREVVVVPGAPLQIFDQVSAVLEACAAGLGFTMTHSRAAEPFLESGALKRLLPDYTVKAHIPGGADIFILYPHRAYLPMKVRVFVDFLVAEFADADVDNPEARVRRRRRVS